MKIKDGDIAPLPSKAEWFAHLMEKVSSTGEVAAESSKIPEIRISLTTK